MLSLAGLAFWALAPGAAVAQGASAPAGGQSPHGAAYERWAVLSSTAVEETGLGDLLSAELSTRDGLDMVERDQLELATAELEIDALFGSGAAGERLKAGRLLGADALILLSLEEREEKRYVKLVISDCRYGARLRFECFPYAAARLDAICRDCARSADETRRCFAEGIRQLIGVTHLLSRDLVHDYDHLQAGYAYLLETALMGFPGVAVVETEEARAIDRELGLAGGELRSRVVPLFVEGEYQVSAAKPQAEPVVRLSLRVSDGKRVRMEFHRDALSASQVPELLRGPIAAQIARLSQESVQTGIGRRQQYGMLTSRAVAFSRLGAFEHSTGLREAALLIDPEDADQRLALVGDYLRWQRARESAIHARRIETLRRADLRADSGNAADDAHDEQLARFRIIAQHVEEVIRRRTLNPREADLLVSTVHNAMLTTGRASTDSSKEKRAAAEKKEIADKLFWSAYPLFPALDPAVRQGAVGPSLSAPLGLGGEGRSKPQSPLLQYIVWTGSAGRFIGYVSPKMVTTGSVGDKTDDTRTLDYLFRFLTEVASPTLPLPLMAKMTTSDSPADLNGMIGSGRLTVDEVIRFYERLMQTGEPLHEFYGRLGLLSIKAYVLQGAGPGPEALDEVDALLEYVIDSDNGDDAYRRVTSRYEHHLGRLRSGLARTVRGATREKRHLLPKNPIPEFDPQPRVGFEPVEGIESDWHGLRKCTQRLDVAWSFDAVYAIPQRGTSERIFHVGTGTSPIAATDRVYGVQWDGESLWIACMTSGIWVVLPTGEVLGHVGAEQGLPPYAPVRGSRYSGSRSPTRGTPLPPPSLALHPVEPGKCLAIGTLGSTTMGTFGGDKRVWFAMVSMKSNAQGDRRFDVDVFHTATKVPNKDNDGADDDPRETFDLAWLTEYVGSGERNQRLLLVGRQGINAAGRSPLAIDLRSRTVFLFPARFPAPGYTWYPRYGIAEHVVVPGTCGTDLFSPPKGGIEGDWVKKSLVQWDAFRRPRLRPVILDHQGALYNPGPEWRRIDPSSWHVEMLTDVPLPLRYRFQHYGVSAHYGLVAWNTGDRLYGVSIDRPLSLPEDLAVLYPHVPAERRAGHHDAVQAIRSMGGSIDAQWGDCPHRWARTKAYQWRTIVYLPEAWQGGDDGLRRLADLHNLRDLYLVRANVSDEGLTTLGRIESLESLYLVETQATDAGLVHLKGLDQLVYLRAEGTSGGREFSDAGLAPLPHLPRLEKLALYGPGFTDAGLETLGAVPNLRELRLLDTRITKAGLSKLTTSRQGRLRCYQDEYRRVFD
jgi:hypothetical protein